MEKGSIRMSHKKWRRKKVPLEMIALKLAEEVGEVTKELTDAHFSGKLDRKNLKEELDQVIRLANTLKERIK